MKTTIQSIRLGLLAAAILGLSAAQLRQTSVVPEPSTWAFGIALCLPPLLAFRRRSRG